MQPFPRREKIAERLWETIFQQGVLIYSASGLAGVDGDALVIGPSFVMEEKDMDKVVDVVAQSVSDLLDRK